MISRRSRSFRLSRLAGLACTMLTLVACERRDPTPASGPKAEDVPTQRAASAIAGMQAPSTPSVPASADAAGGLMTPQAGTEAAMPSNSPAPATAASGANGSLHGSPAPR